MVEYQSYMVRITKRDIDGKTGYVKEAEEGFEIRGILQDLSGIEQLGYGKNTLLSREHYYLYSDAKLPLGARVSGGITKRGVDVEDALKTMQIIKRTNFSDKDLGHYRYILSLVAEKE